MKIGDKVTTKKLGLPVVGTITCILDGGKFRLFTTMMAGSLKIYKIWDKHYPKWEEKKVIQIFTDKPSKVISFEEFQEIVNSNDTERLMSWYDSLSKHYVLTYPEDDLELFEEI